MGATLNFIEIWIKLLENNYDARLVAYSPDMKDMFKQIPTTISKPLSPRQKLQIIMTEMGGGWHMEKLLIKYHH